MAAPTPPKAHLWHGICPDILLGWDLKPGTENVIPAHGRGLDLDDPQPPPDQTILWPSLLSSQIQCFALCWENLFFPLTPLTNTPVVLGAGSGAGPGVPVLTHPRGLHRDRAHRQGRTDLESCHTALQMWKCFSGRLKDFFFSPKLHTPTNIWQICILSLFVCVLLNTIMISSCVAGGPIHWHFTAQFIFSYCIISVFPLILLCACRMPDVSYHTYFLLFVLLF